jgi:hypothetical protein
VTVSSEARHGLMQQHRDRMRAFVETGTVFLGQLEGDVRRAEQRGLRDLAADLRGLQRRLGQAVADARRVLDDSR